MGAWGDVWVSTGDVLKTCSTSKIAENRRERSTSTTVGVHPENSADLERAPGAGSKSAGFS